MSLTRQPFGRGFRAKKRDQLRKWYEVPKQDRQQVIFWLDRLVSEIVRRRDGHRCVICKSTYQPQAAHIFSRKNFAARWDLENVWCNCPDCNWRHNTDPTPYYLWANKHLGPERFDALRYRALSNRKVEVWEMSELLDRLRREYPNEAKAVERRAA